MLRPIASRRACSTCAPVTSSWRGKRWGAISITETRRPGATRARAVSSPSRPPPMTATLRNLVGQALDGQRVVERAQGKDALLVDALKGRDKGAPAGGQQQPVVGLPTAVRQAGCGARPGPGPSPACRSGRGCRARRTTQRVENRALPARPRRPGTARAGGAGSRDRVQSHRRGPRPSASARAMLCAAVIPATPFPTMRCRGINVLFLYTECTETQRFTEFIRASLCLSVLDAPPCSVFLSPSTRHSSHRW